MFNQKPSCCQESNKQDKNLQISLFGLILHYGLDEFRVMSVPSTGFTCRFSQYENLNILKILYATVQNWPIIVV